jgi:hypothetical protein
MASAHSLRQHGSSHLLKNVYLPIGVLPGSDCQLEQSEEGRSARLTERQSETSPKATSDSPLLWVVLGTLFAALVFGYPLLLAADGNPLSVRYLWRLVSSILLVALVALVAGLLHLASTPTVAKR